MTYVDQVTAGFRSIGPDMQIEITNSLIACAIGTSPNVCAADYRNPCLPPSVPLVEWNGRHWGGGPACAACHARWALAMIEAERSR